MSNSDPPINLPPISASLPTMQQGNIDPESATQGNFRDNQFTNYQPSMYVFLT
jgi:hypothetical protein